VLNLLYHAILFEHGDEPSYVASGSDVHHLPSGVPSKNDNTIQTNLLGLEDGTNCVQLPMLRAYDF
jgi:hypothetical protein